MRIAVSVVLCSGIFASVPIGASARDVAVFSQPTTVDDGKVGLGWYSQSEPRVRKNFKHADDFILGADAEVGRIVWWGQSSKHRHDDLTNFDTFQVEFFEAVQIEGEWLPGDLLAAEVFAIDGTSPTETGRVTPAGAKEYRHEATLGVAFAAGAGTRYFLAVSAGMIETNSASDAWQWQDADLVDGWSATYSWASSEWTGYQDSDSAFELYAVPAPGTLGAVCLGLAAWKRRRR